MQQKIYESCEFEIRAQKAWEEAHDVRCGAAPLRAGPVHSHALNILATNGLGFRVKLQPIRYFR